jgi:single-strand DNA-binding protein
MLNQCQFIGRIAKNPEFKRTQSGTQVCNFSLAINEKYTNKSGEKVEHTEWINVVVWNKNLMPFLENYVQKGALLYVQGKMKTRSWEQDGVKRYSTEVVVQSFGDEIKKLSWDDEQKPVQSSVQYDDLDDEIPFS